MNKLCVGLLVSELLLQTKPFLSHGESVYVTTGVSSGKPSVSASPWLSFLIRKTFIYHVFISPEQIIHYQQVINDYLPKKYLDTNKITTKKYGSRVYGKLLT